jgi:ATP-binding cassette subfamily B protein
MAVPMLFNFIPWQDADWLLVHGTKSLVSLERLADLARELAPSMPGLAPADGMPAQVLRIENVGFRYPGTERQVFSGLSLDIPAGRSLAIVGENGAGKTTLVKLLARLYDPVEGVISVDGHDLRGIEPSAWRRRVAVIFQDFVHYHLSVRDNVGFGDLALLGSQDALDRAAALAGADDTIASLPRGWDTIVAAGYKEGVDLSGGQWQRIALARALLAAQGGGILILDEPTASLDVRAEAELFDRFLDLTTGLTTVLISHRFSTVRRADRICVLEHGKVIELGSHDELLAARGRYAEMFELQASRFADVDEEEPDMELAGGGRGRDR